ncbi:hypothetical protein BJ165DRAFT_1409760 [Panaeolus papilionaceus]|nr:hypothetical protein BJ165DRAFT_1409760 [Panaeolus papilionaceus]
MRYIHTPSLDIYAKRYPGGLPYTISGPSTARTPTSAPPDSGPGPVPAVQPGHRLCLLLTDLYNASANTSENLKLFNGGRSGCRAEVGSGPLDCNARCQSPVARIKMGDEEEGKYHASVIPWSDMLDYSVLFLEIADACIDKETYEGHI